MVYDGFLCSSDEGAREIPAECAVKVFKTTLNEFKNRIEYVKDDYRFKNPRKVLKVWAEREMMNLARYVLLRGILGMKVPDPFPRVLEGRCESLESSGA